MRNVRYISWLYALLALGYAGAFVGDLHVHLAFAFLTASFAFTLKRPNLGLSAEALVFLMASLSGAITIAYLSTGAPAWILMGLYCAGALGFLAGPAARAVGDGLLLIVATAVYTVSAGVIRSPYFLPTVPLSLFAATGVFIALSFPNRRAPLWKMVAVQAGFAAALSILLFLVHPLPVNGLRAAVGWLGRRTGITKDEAAASRSGGSLWTLWPVKIQDTSPAKGDPTPVLRVKINEGREFLRGWPDKPELHLRAAVYTDYGRGYWTTIWRYEGKFDTVRPGWVGPFTQGVDGRVIDGTVTALLDPARVIFTLYQPESFQLPELEEAGGTFRVRAEMPALQEYAFRALAPDRGELKFKAAPPGRGDALTNFIPPELDPLARHGATICAEAASADDKVKRVIRELDTRCMYEMYPAGPPGAQDPIVWFFESERRGNCRHFATAALAMLRGAGVPCRLVTGFGSTDWDAAARSFTVRMRDMHAWIEVDVEGFGWITYDPTPALIFSEEGGRTVAHAKKEGQPPGEFFDPETGVITALDPGPQPRGPTWIQRLSDYSGLVIPEIPWIVSGLAVVALIVLLLMPAAKRAVRRARGSTSDAARSPVAFLNEFLALLKSAGHAPGPSETMPRFASRLPSSCPREAVAAIVGLYHRARFGGGPLKAPERDSVRAALGALRTALKRG